MYYPSLKVLSGIVLISSLLFSGNSVAQPLVGLVDFETHDGAFTVENGGEGGGIPTGPWVYNAGAGTWSADGGLGVVNTRLTSRTLTVGQAGPVSVVFNHRYNFEDDGTVRWDGGVIRVSVNGGPFEQVLSTSLTGENYKTDKTIGGNSPPLFGLFGFNNTSAGFAVGTFVQTTAALGTFAMGDTIAFQFIGAWDEGFLQTPAPNWEVDTVEFIPPLEDRNPRVAPTFTDPAHPVDAIVAQDQSYTLEVFADGDPFPALQWYKDGAPIPGATGTSYTITNMTAADADLYFVRANSLAGTADSREANIGYVADTFPPILNWAALSSDGSFLLAFDEALHPDGPDPFGVSIYPAGGDPYGDNLVVGSAVVTNESQAILLVLTVPTPGVDYVLDLYGYSVADVHGNFLTDPVIAFPIATEDEVLSFDSVWEYDQSGTDLGTNWLQAGAPSLPNSGPGLLGQETTGGSVALIRTDLNAPNEGGAQGYYFRTFFVIGSASSLVSLTADYYIDDAAAVYINGTEVHRTAFETRVLPGVPGEPIPYGTQPAAAVGNAELVSGIAIPTDSVVDGVNTIQVYVGQAGANSSDVVWGMRLLAVGGGGVSLQILQHPQDVSVEENETVNLSVVASGNAPLSYQWRKDGVDITDATNSAYNVVGAIPADSGDYTVVVSDVADSVTSDPAMVTVAADVTPPTLVSAVADITLTNITLTFSEPVEMITATDPFNYMPVENPGGTALQVLSATFDPGDPSVVVLATAPMTVGVNYDLTVSSSVTDRASVPNPMVEVTVRICATLEVFAVGQVWKYDERDVDLGTAWRAAAFDDSLWPEGPSALGVEANLTIATPLQRLYVDGGGATNAQETTTYYFRTRFDFTAEVASSELEVVANFDDGFVMYLNGVEVLREGIGATNEVSHADLFASHEADGFESFNIGNANVLAGENVIAVEVHQTSIGSSDIVWDMALNALVKNQVSTPSLGLTITRLANGDVEVSWTDSAGDYRLVAAPDVDGPYSDAGIGQVSPYTFTPGAGSRGFFQLVNP